MTTDRFRETAIKHARIIEDQKKVKSQVTDLILECFDLPSHTDASPASPSPADAKTFKRALSLFQPSDFDELASERNIDDRCGYALCPQPNRKHTGGGNKVWNRKGGKDFQLLDRAEVERWCSPECQKRGQYARSQLSTEPAWVRDVTETQVVLLDEAQSTDSLSQGVQQLSISNAPDQDLRSRLKALANERGDRVESAPVAIEISEKSANDEMTAPPQPEGMDSIEGHIPRRVRFEADESG